MSTYAYLRMSTNDQQMSPEIQKARITEYRASRGLPAIDEWFADLGVTGKKRFADRPEGAALLRRLRRGDQLLVAKMDRLGRNGMDILNTIYRLEEAGAQVVVVDFYGMELDTKNPIGRMILALVAHVCELERANIASRTKEALAHLAREGRSHGGVYPPLGFTHYVDELGRTCLARDEREVGLIKRVLEWQAEGFGLTAIVQRLVEQGHRSSSGAKYTRKRLYVHLIKHRRKTLAALGLAEFEAGLPTYTAAAKKLRSGRVPGVRRLPA